MTENIQGLPASPGITIGPIWVYQPIEVDVQPHEISDPEAELERLTEAIQKTQAQLNRLAEKARTEIGEEEAQIFEAHLLFLEDPELLKKIKSLVNDDGINTEAAVDQGVETFAQTLEAMENEYFQERAQDVRDVGRRLLWNLEGVDPAAMNFPLSPSIIAAEDLTPSDTVQFDREIILGFCTVGGGPTSHAAILAQSLNVPAVVSADFEVDPDLNGTTAILDGKQGLLILDPEEDVLEEYRAKMQESEEEWNELLAQADQKAVTQDGVHVEVVANIGNVEDARQAVEFGAEGVGLLRTEFLYIDREEFPSLDEQVEGYQDIGQIMEDRLVVVRTLDIGGDKPVPYLDLEEEPNPFLGWRAIRMIKEQPHILAQQLKALLLGFASNDLRIMLPLVSQIEEIQHARDILQGVTQQLEEEKGFVHPQLQFGMMVEVPSAALQIEHFAEYVDFFSIGTNDLAQYTLAVDRTNERVAGLASPFHPAVIQLIARTIREAHAQDKWVGLCGEMAGNPLAAPLLLGLGLDEFSMAPAAIPRVKHLLRNLSAEQCAAYAERALTLKTTQEVLEYLSSLTTDLE